MGKLRFDIHHPISWPEGCAICGAPAMMRARVSHTVATGYYLFAYAQRTHFSDYPVCRKHRFLCSVLDRPSRWGFVGKFWALLIIPGVLLVFMGLTLAVLFGIKGEALDSILSVVGIGSFVMTLGFLIFAPRYQPVRIVEADKESLTFEIKNEEYFRQFKSLNVAAKSMRSDSVDLG